MIKIANGGPKDLLPPILKDIPHMQAYSYAIEQAIGKVLTFSRRTLMYASVDEQPENILDYMAVESRAQYYDESMDIETKREIIKNSLAWYLKAGTQESVNELIETVFGEGKSVPWYDFGDGSGTPGLFDIITSTQMEPMMYERFNRIIEKAKNQSSMLRYITVEHTTNDNWMIAFGLAEQEVGTISNDIHIDNPEQAMFLSEYIAVDDEAQAVDKTIIGELDAVSEQLCIYVPACILTEMEEMILSETLTEAEYYATPNNIRHMAIASEQMIRSGDL